MMRLKGVVYYVKVEDVMRNKFRVGKPVSIYLNKELWERADKVRQEMGISVSHMVGKGFETELKKYEAYLNLVSPSE